MEIICADSLLWLPQHRNCGAIATSIPDADELGMVDAAQYAAWFAQAAAECFLSASPNTPVCFYQTDRRIDGEWFDKSHALHTVADGLGYRLLFHKIAVRVSEPGACDLRLVGYSHVLAFGKGTVVAYPGPSGANVRGVVVSTDVLPHSPALHNATGTALGAARMLAAFCRKFTDKLVDPFCGSGTIPAAFEEIGGQAVGVDLSEKACDTAGTLLFLPPTYIRAN